MNSILSKISALSWLKLGTGLFGFAIAIAGVSVFLNESTVSSNETVAWSLITGLGLVFLASVLSPNKRGFDTKVKILFALLLAIFLVNLQVIFSGNGGLSFFGALFLMDLYYKVIKHKLIRISVWMKMLLIVLGMLLLWSFLVGFLNVLSVLKMS